MTLTKVFIYTFLFGGLITVLFSFVKKPKSWLVAVLKNFVGSLFIFSGIVKAIDPLGTAYKMNDYFEAFGGIFEMFSSISIPLAVFMIVFEVVLGLALILGYKSKWTVALSFSMILFFTILTGYTYLNGFVNPDYFDEQAQQIAQESGETISFFQDFNPLHMKVTDCGCFGDFLKIEPKHSFFKDIFLLSVIIVFLIYHRFIEPVLSQHKWNLAILSVTTIGLLMFCFSNYVWNLPMADFRPYKVGNNIPEQMESVPPIIDYFFVFENAESGERAEIPISEWSTYSDNPDWEYTGERVENILDEGIPAKISNFAAYDDDGIDVTDNILSNEGYSFWVLSKELDSSCKEAWEALNELSELADQTDLITMFAFANQDADAFRHEVQAAYPFYVADQTFIKTVIRANPGLVLMKDGVILKKWHHKHIPPAEEMFRIVK